MSIHNQPNLPRINQPQPIAQRGQLRKTAAVDKNLSQIAQAAISSTAQPKVVPARRGPPLAVRQIAAQKKAQQGNALQKMPDYMGKLDEIDKALKKNEATRKEDHMGDVGDYLDEYQQNPNLEDVASKIAPFASHTQFQSTPPASSPRPSTQPRNHYDDVTVPLDDNRIQYSKLPAQPKHQKEPIMSRDEKLYYNQLAATARKRKLTKDEAVLYNKLHVKFNRFYANEFNQREGAQKYTPGSDIPPPRETLNKPPNP